MPKVNLEHLPPWKRCAVRRYYRTARSGPTGLPRIAARRATIRQCLEWLRI